MRKTSENIIKFLVNNSRLENRDYFKKENC